MSYPGQPAIARARRATKSLRFKATSAFVAFLCLVAAGLSFLFLATWEQQERMDAQRRALQTAQALAEGVAPASWVSPSSLVFSWSSFGPTKSLSTRKSVSPVARWM